VSATTAKNRLQTKQANGHVLTVRPTTNTLYGGAQVNCMHVTLALGRHHTELLP
jgi:hypothetical protein